MCDNETVKKKFQGFYIKLTTMFIKVSEVNTIKDITNFETRQNIINLKLNQLKKPRHCSLIIKPHIRLILFLFEIR